jgi:N-acylneuraminate cytidylyltransferase
MGQLKVLVTIPARGGSKGIPHKNLRPLAGKPLLAHTIEPALRASTVDRVVVSTDDSQIADVALAAGAEVVRRPAEISGDAASSESALLHALDYLLETEGYEPNLVVFLQATAPLRQPGDIDRAVRQLLAEDADSLLSVVRTHTWLWRVVEGRPQSFNYDYRQRLRRQDRPAEYSENGSIYVFKPWVLRRFNNRLGGKIAFYEMGPWSDVDIDTLEDLELAEWILERGYCGSKEQ